VLLAIPVVNGKSKYQSYFIVKKDFEYKDLKSLKGKTIAFTDKLSFSGTLYPLYFFKNNDIDIEKYFSNIYFTGNHDKSIYLVSKGVVDIAPVDSLIYEHEKIVSPEVINNTKVIFKSPDFPIPPIIASKKINVRLLNRIKSILINMDKDEKGRKILRQLNIDRFEDGLGYDYSDVIKISREVENYKIINTK
jgi:phosphonate transport system substrate-binding protein